MKKTILTFGLFSMVMVLTSFTTPVEHGDVRKQQYVPATILSSFHAPEATIYGEGVLMTLPQKQDLEPGGAIPSMPKKLDFDYKKSTLSIQNLDNEPGGAVPSIPKKNDLL